ncbi:hypothetical protein [uncultured Jannaschia sp.]|uniref:hypothetical protein n=1 Tax=uncultured Jannaschia sp. TaxID=293347 RepID=UPI00261ECE6C|nr:hypothetical protein [uncultured Jannaschia sp.]
MFLIAGLLGVLVSGALMFAPTGHDTAEEAPAPDGDASAGDESPLTVATNGDGESDDRLADGTGDRLAGGDGTDLFLFRAPPVAFIEDGPATLSSAAADDGLAIDDGPPLIEDFDPGEDLIEIAYGADEPVPDLTITCGPAGQEVRLDGEIVAHVAGTASVEAAHIRLVAWV